MPKPALGPIAVGDRLVVIPARNPYHPRANVEVEVVSKGRVWLDLKEVNQVASLAHTWRMRMDTQDAGGNYSNVDRFVTAEQLAWEQRIDAARSVLREAKASPDFVSRWHRDEDRLVALADFIAAYDAEYSAV